MLCRTKFVYGLTSAPRMQKARFSVTSFLLVSRELDGVMTRRGQGTSRSVIVVHKSLVLSHADDRRLLETLFIEQVLGFEPIVIK